MGIYSDGVSLLLRRNRVDKKYEEATFVCTDSVRFTGSVKFEVFDKEELVLCGVFEKQSNCTGFTGEGNRNGNQWSMNCESDITTASGFLKEKQVGDSEFSLPSMEVYVAGSFLGTPIILTRTLQLRFRKKHNRKGALDSIPEYETTQSPNAISSELDLQFKEYRNYKLESEEEYNSSMYWRTEYNIDGEDGELSWFNAGVRVGVGIGLGICLGVGIGVGLLVRSYHATTRNFKRRLV
jgi:hypothetical protein